MASSQSKWFAIGDDSGAYAASGKRRIEAYVVLSIDPGFDRTFRLTRAIVEWRNKHAPASIAAPPLDSGAFGQVAFSSVRNNSLRWNHPLEPKWAGLQGVLRADTGMLADKARCNELFGPIGELLDILKSHSIGLVILDLPQLAQTHVAQHVALRTLREALTELIGGPDVHDVQVRFDRDDASRYRRACVEAADPRWALGRAKSQVSPNSTLELAKRALACQHWALLNHRSPLTLDSESEGTRWHASFSALVAEARTQAETAYEGYVRSGAPDIDVLLAANDEWCRLAETKFRLAPADLRAASDSLLRALDGTSTGKPARLDGPHPLETELAPLMIAPDIIAGLYAFLAHTRRDFRSPGRPMGPARSLSNEELRHVLRCLNLKGGEPRSDLSERLGCRVLGS